MRIVTFNVQHGRTSSGDVVDPALLSRTCAGFDADVLALQEVDVGVPRSGLVDEPATIAEATGMSFFFGEAAPIHAQGFYGNALLVRGVIGNVDVLRLPHLRRSERRTAILASLELESGERCSIAATHLSYYSDEATVQLPLVLEALTARPAPWLLAGDLNLEPADVEAPVRRAGLVLAPGGPTFPAAAPTTRIDHIARSPQLSFESVMVPETGCSDHRPLIVDLVYAAGQ